VASQPPRWPRAPTQPPLLSGGASTGTSADAEENQGAGAQGETDPLVSNGLSSPTCKGALAGELGSTNTRNCETSGFLAAADPTGDYGIDVHIDVGVFGFSAGGIQSYVQDLLVTPVWTALVWAVHSLVVMVEWCFNIDLLDSSTAGAAGSGLRRAQASFTAPWLALALSFAAIAFAYHGLIRRRVANTLGEALLMAGMMVVGMWIIADPAGTVGAVADWANEASLGTLAVAAAGTPAAPGRALAANLDTVFATAIEDPWCYLEFGNVSWCRDPSRLDPALRTAGLSIAAHEMSSAGCGSSSACADAGSSAQALEHSAQLLREARSNGAIFLALPANGPARNSINEEHSLLHTLCQSSEATDCHGPTAAQAEFRTGSHTISRLIGLVLILAGLLGMLLLLGFLAMRLLLAAIFSLLYLLFAPAVVLAPAFGESGRAVFRKWAAQLFGAVVSKLLFAFLLGAVLAVLEILSSLSAIGWWTQWLLMSAFWWGAFTRRHQALGLIAGGVGAEHLRQRSVIGRVNEGRRRASDARTKVRERRRPAPEVPPRSHSDRDPATAAQRREQVAGQSKRSLETEHRQAKQRDQRKWTSKQRVEALGKRLGDLRSERTRALEAGDQRRAISLRLRAERVERDLEEERLAGESAQRIAKTTPGDHVRANGAAREQFLDTQAALPSSRETRTGDKTLGGKPERRDYVVLAGLLGHTREEYQRLDPRAQREARLEIDRELDLRRELGRELGHTGAAHGAQPQSGDTRPGPSRTTDRAGRAPRRADTGDRAAPTTGDAIDPALIRAAQESQVMRDMHDLAARRRRQLGGGSS
jgi:hypothetical protein